MRRVINVGDDVQCPRCGVQPLANTGMGAYLNLEVVGVNSLCAH